MPTQRVESYYLYHSEGGSPAVTMNCYRDNDWVGTVEFWEGSVPAPHVVGSDVVILRFPMSRYEEIITTMRYEKPLYIAVYDDLSRVGTREREPIGEEES